MFDALSRLYEGGNINRKMALRTQLKNVKVQKPESIHAFFTRISQINERIITIDDSAKEVELVMTTLNGLMKSWDSFIRGICSRSKLTKFSRLWKDCVKEKARLEAREEKLSDDEDQALVAHFRKRKKKKENHPPLKKFQKFEKSKRDYSKLKCFCSEKLGHLATDCPLIKEAKERRKNKRHHAHIVEDDELVFKRERKEDSDEEYVLVAVLTNSVNYYDETWLVDSGASRHMTGFKDPLSNLTKKDSSHQVKLGDNSSYPIKGIMLFIA
jgi:hypothetical protein